MNERKIIMKASEVGDYVYCKRGWWLKGQGLLPTTSAMVQGSQQHSRLLSFVLQHKILSLITLLFIGIGLLCLILWIALIYLF